MVNSSKARDPRFWKIWEASGAVGDKYEAERRESLNHFKKLWSSSGNLSREEVRKLVHYEFRQGADTVEEQVERYYLKLKDTNPKLAEEMWVDAKPFLKGNLDDSQVKSLCSALAEYWGGVVINHNGTTYNVGEYRGLNLLGKEQPIEKRVQKVLTLLAEGYSLDYLLVKGDIALIPKGAKKRVDISRDLHYVETFLALQKEGLIEQKSKQEQGHRYFTPSFQNPVCVYGITDKGRKYLKEGPAPLSPNISHKLKSKPEVAIEVPRGYVEKVASLEKELLIRGPVGLAATFDKYPCMGNPGIFDCAKRIASGKSRDVYKSLDELFLRVCINLNQPKLKDPKNEEAYALDAKLIQTLEQVASA